MFDEGVAAYAQQDYRLAQEAFREVARREPRAADAWANYGTASWAIGDTARAVAGWQRAVDRSGMPGLRVTRIKHYRDQYERQQRY